MAYRVRITAVAVEDIEESLAFYTEKGSLTVAAKWLDDLDAVMDKAADNPLGCPLAPENEDLDFECRQTHCHSHRVLFMVELSTETLHILRVYHGARRPVSPSDFRGER
jgi:plasmid stabilization system protein ParE